MTLGADSVTTGLGTAAGADFLSLPGRPPKPRQVGVTHVIDKGLPLAAVEGVLEASGDYIDIVKLGWGTAYVTRNLRDKLSLYRDAGIPVVLGGTFWELCLAQQKLDEWRRWVTDLGLHHVEISDGTITCPTTRSWSTSPASHTTSSCSARSARRTSPPSSPPTAGSS
jgi:phosphosulfolactate synthase (CoM biosynthesis protein A)